MSISLVAAQVISYLISNLGTIYFSFALLIKISIVLSYLQSPDTYKDTHSKGFRFSQFIPALSHTAERSTWQMACPT
jgi:hypothetical protein